MSLKTLLYPVYRKQQKNINAYLNKRGTKRECNICHGKQDHFEKYRGGLAGLSDFLKMTIAVGSDLDNYRCIHCGSNDRLRHLYMFFDKIGFWDKFKGAEILHFAPEKELRKRIKDLQPKRYVLADFNPKTEDEIKVDATDIQMEDDSFDMLICNHVLEHIPDYKKALNEFNRVLRPGGTAILQTPYAKLLKRNFEDENIVTDAQRNFFYGQEDHVRLYSEEQFFNDVRSAGFDLRLGVSKEMFTKQEMAYYGVNPLEDLIMAINKS